jgi:hypothetical protein
MLEVTLDNPPLHSICIEPRVVADSFASRGATSNMDMSWYRMQRLVDHFPSADTEVSEGVGFPPNTVFHYRLHAAIPLCACRCLMNCRNGFDLLPLLTSPLSYKYFVLI